MPEMRNRNPGYGRHPLSSVWAPTGSILAILSSIASAILTSACKIIQLQDWRGVGSILSNSTPIATKLNISMPSKPASRSTYELGELLFSKQAYKSWPLGKAPPLFSRVEAAIGGGSPTMSTPDGRLLE